MNRKVDTTETKKNVSVTKIKTKMKKQSIKQNKKLN